MEVVVTYSMSIIKDEVRKINLKLDSLEQKMAVILEKLESKTKVEEIKLEKKAK